MVGNIAIADFCTVIEQESMSKPVFWYLMFKALILLTLAFSLPVAIWLINFISIKRSWPFKVSSRTSSHKLEIQQLHITALYTYY